MKRNFLILVLAIVVIFVYVVFINFIANSLIGSTATTGYVQESNGGGDVRLGIGDKVDVTVTRNRWYGTIVENSGEKTRLATLYFLNFIALPLNVNGTSFFLVHLIFLVLVVISSFFISKKMKRSDFERGFA